MSNAKASAFPTTRQINPNTLETEVYPEAGLTKLEYFAGLAMQGLLGSQYWMERRTLGSAGADAAEDSLHCAKALIAELEKAQP